MFATRQRRARTLLLGVSGLFLIVPALARAPDFAFPENLSGFARGPRTDYESRAPGYGYSVVYTNGRWKADVYVYDGGVASIPEGATSPAVATQAEHAVREIGAMVERGHYRSSQDRGVVRLNGATGRKFACRAFAIDHTALGSTESLMCITGLRGKFVKFRLSSPVAAQAPQAEAEQFITRWLAQQ
ncbi:hypothetical protein [Methylobacterium sp. 77]|uniref:hypothetical protein n=1 Tax=Methylobacterium sp. 77 TaxID=1101192 RepID=UPI00039B139B|nr:hypothetical protein [Methylobacterium sp. 77]